MIEQVPQDVIHQGLEDCVGVIETEGDDKVFKVVEGSVESSLPITILLDPDQMIGISEVQFGKNSGHLEGLQGRSDKGQRLFVSNGDVIEATIINTGVKGLILLGEKEEPYTNQRRGRHDDTAA